MTTRQSVHLRSAFTLVEVLVVIAIIGLLLGLLVPSLAASRDSARSSVCSSNIRQLLLALDMYASDARDRYAPGAPDFITNRTRWHGSRASSTGAFAPAGGTLTAYLAPDSDAALVASRLARSCPSFAATARSLVDAGAGFERSAGGYGYNNAYVGVERGQERATPSRSIRPLITDLLGAPRARFARPVAVAAFADGALADGNTVAGVAEYSFIEPRFWPDAPTSRPDPSIHFRHASGPAGLANIGALDGHVRPESLKFTQSSGVFDADPARVRIGWFGQFDNNSAFGVE
jgi:prepilin-type N-terminal cleavage/methylation domain-containing protein